MVFHSNRYQITCQSNYCELIERNMNLSENYRDMYTIAKSRLISHSPFNRGKSILSTSTTFNNLKLYFHKKYTVALNFGLVRSNENVHNV